MRVDLDEAVGEQRGRPVVRGAVDVGPAAAAEADGPRRGARDAAEANVEPAVVRARPVARRVLEEEDERLEAVVPPRRVHRVGVVAAPDVRQRLEDRPVRRVARRPAALGVDGRAPDVDAAGAQLRHRVGEPPQVVAAVAHDELRVDAPRERRSRRERRVPRLGAIGARAPGRPRRRPAGPSVAADARRVPLFAVGGALEAAAWLAAHVAARRLVALLEPPTVARARRPRRRHAGTFLVNTARATAASRRRRAARRAARECARFIDARVATPIVHREQAARAELPQQRLGGLASAAAAVGKKECDEESDAHLEMCRW